MLLPRWSLSAMECEIFTPWITRLQRRTLGSFQIHRKEQFLRPMDIVLTKMIEKACRLR